MPAFMGGFANYLLPVQIGAPDIKRCLNTKSLFNFKIGSYLAGL
jgi:heme/copper-type cytochrome/quinol oxidase subunit 1